MLKNYLITAIRNLKRYKSYSVINLVGMSGGLAATILIYTFISHELSYDKFHRDHKQIYRIVSLLEMAGDHSVKAPYSMGTMPPLLKDAIPEIKEITRLEDSEVEIKFGNQSFFNNKRFIADSSFLDIFSFKIIEGNVDNPISKPGTVAITRELSEKIFGGGTATGESLSINDKYYEVTAVLENIPANSHMSFDLLISFASIEDEEKYIEQKGFSFHSYFVLKEDAVHKDALEKTGQYINDYYEETLEGLGLSATPMFQPLDRIHLFSEDLQFEMTQRGKISNVYIFSLLALFILLIAIVNQVNLVTARSETRSKEIALRKIAGSSRLNLITQFLSESIVTTVISLVIAISLVELLIHPFGNLLNRDLGIDYLSAGSVIFFFTITFSVGIGAGAYPAFYLSGLDPVRIFQKQSGSRAGGLLKIILVVFQFSIAIFMIISLIILYSQTRYMQDYSPGFNKENILVVENISRDVTDNYLQIRDELLAETSVISVTASEGIPGNQATVQNSWLVEDNRENAIMIFENRVQDDFFETYQIPVLEGRTFSGDRTSDKSAFVINQAAARGLGLDDPLGKEIFVWNNRGTIIGVVSDFNFESLHEPIKPIVHSRYSDYFRFISIRISPENVSSTINSIGETLNDFDPDYVYSSDFLDSRLRHSYESEERSNKLIGMSAILSVILSVMGLYSLTSFTILRKTKEIGIRKAMGSSINSLLLMLYRDMGQWILLANVIAWPAAWLIMNKWLDNFAFRIEPELWMFLIAGIAALSIAMLTITGLAIKAINTNPVDALRYE